MNEESSRFLYSLIEYPEETALTDYKAAVAFDSKSDFGAKLVKHILGQANSGGGYIVIGCIEDEHRKLCRDPSLAEDVSRSYETTRLCQSVDAFLRNGQRIQLHVHKITFEGRIYPIISISEFDGSPFFCGKDFFGKDGKQILSAGALFVRDHAAKTVELAGPVHWKNLLQVAVHQSQNDLLGEFRRLLQNIGIATAASKDSVPSEISRWIEEQRAKAKESMQRHNIGDAGFFEVSHFPKGIELEWKQSELLQAAQKAICHNRGWPIGVVMTKPELAPKPTPDGIEASIFSNFMWRGFDHWAIDRHGTFYLLRAFDEDLAKEDPAKKYNGQVARYFWFDSHIWMMAETLLHCSKLYTSLGVPSPALVNMTVSYSGLKDRLLSAHDPLRRVTLFQRKCEADSLVWRKTIEGGAIETNLESLVGEITSELFTLFEFWKPADAVWKGILNQFLVLAK